MNFDVKEYFITYWTNLKFKTIVVLYVFLNYLIYLKTTSKASPNSFIVVYLHRSDFNKTLNN